MVFTVSRIPLPARQPWAAAQFCTQCFSEVRLRPIVRERAVREGNHMWVWRSLTLGKDPRLVACNAPWSQTEVVAEGWAPKEGCFGV